jgi:hypothetical protein
MLLDFAAIDILVFLRQLIFSRRRVDLSSTQHAPPGTNEWCCHQQAFSMFVVVVALPASPTATRPPSLNIIACWFHAK